MQGNKILDMPFIRIKITLQSLKTNHLVVSSVFEQYKA